jgi:antitoxin component YwqK of YwqJK toxin-antitoxin module
MKNFIFAAVLFFSLVSFGQSSNDKVIYKDSDFNEVDSINYTHKYIVKKYDEEKEIYEVEKFVKINEKNVLEAIYQVRDKNNFVLNGVCKIFKENKVQTISNYINNRLNGEYFEYYEDGKIKIEGEYKIQSDKEIFYYKNYWDLNGKQIIKDYKGHFEYFHEGKILIEGEIFNGLVNGKWVSKNEEFPKYEYNFKNNELIDGIIYKSENDKRKIKKNESASPKNGLENFQKNLREGIQIMLNRARVSAGNYKVIVRFVVYEDGSIQEIEVVKNGEVYLESDVKSIFKKLDYWNSEVVNGIEIKKKLTQPIIIDLN